MEKTTVKAQSKYLRQSPYKLRLVLNLIRGLEVQDALNVLTTNKTSIVIAHRLSTILNSEKIYVVDKGSVESSGKHDDLIKNSLLYKNFYERQIKNN